MEIFSHRLSQFSSDIWLECAQQYCPQNCGTRIFIFLLLIFFYWFLITKNKSKLEILQVFGNFLWKFSMGPHKTWFTCMLWVILSVWKMSLVDQFFGPFLAPNKAKIGNFGGFWPFSQKNLIPDSETWFTGILSVFSGLCEKLPLWVKFLAPISVWYKTEFGSQNLATNFGNHLYGLPKLAANISSKFHHLVNTGLAVGSLVKWLPIKVATPANYTQFKWFITRRLEMAPSDCNCL